MSLIYKFEKIYIFISAVLKLLKIFLRFFFFRVNWSLNQEASNVMLYYLEAVVDSRKNQKDPSSNPGSAICWQCNLGKVQPLYRTFLFSRIGIIMSVQFSSVQSLSCVRLFATPWIAVFRISELWNNVGCPGSSAGKESSCNAGDPGLIPGLGRSAGEGIGCPLEYSWASLVAQMVKNPPSMRETWVRSLGWEDPPEEGMATHSSILAWRIPWTEEPGGLQSTGLQRVRYDWATKHSTTHEIMQAFSTMPGT